MTVARRGSSVPVGLDAADHVDVLDLGHFAHQRGDLVGRVARVLEPAAGRQFEREDDAAGVLARDEAGGQETHRVDRAGEKQDAGGQRHPAEPQLPLSSAM